MRVDTVHKSDDMLSVVPSATVHPFSLCCCFGTNNPYLLLSRAKDHEANGFLRVFKHEVARNTVAPVWKTLNVKI